MGTCLHILINASVDALGLPRFDLPAEYIAAGISLFVSPVNVHAACVFAPPCFSSEDQGRSRSPPSVGRVTSAQLFALVIQLYSSTDRISARGQFEKNTRIALSRVEPSVGKGAK